MLAAPGKWHSASTPCPEEGESGLMHSSWAMVFRSLVQQRLKKAVLQKALIFSYILLDTAPNPNFLRGEIWAFAKVKAKRSYNPKHFVGNTQCSQIKYAVVIIGCNLQWVNNLLQAATKTGMKWPAKTCLPASVQMPLPLFSPDSFYSVAKKDFSLCSVLLIILLLGLLRCLYQAAVALQVSDPWEMFSFPQICNFPCEGQKS